MDEKRLKAKVAELLCDQTTTKAECEVGILEHLEKIIHQAEVMYREVEKGTVAVPCLDRIQDQVRQIRDKVVIMNFADARLRVIGEINKYI